MAGAYRASRSLRARGHTAEDVASLRLVQDQLTEGRDTALIARARALLAAAGEARGCRR